MTNLMILIVLSILGGILYRLGGRGEPFNTKYRDFGIPTIMVLLMTILSGWHWSFIACALLMFAAQTSYFKKKGTDAKWWNWLFVGLAFSACMIPYAWGKGIWIGFIYRSIIVTGFTILWSQFIDNDFWEESGRGFIQIITLVLL